MTNRPALADALDPRGKTPSTESKGSTCFRLFEIDERDLIAASDLLRLPPADEIAGVCAGLAEIATRQMTRPSDARLCEQAVSVLERLALPAAEMGTVERCAKLCDEYAVQRGEMMDAQGETAAEDLAAAIRSLTPQATAAEEWRPIESAPKDGTAVILYVNEGPSVRVGRWEEWAVGEYLWCMDAGDAFYDSAVMAWRSLPLPPSPSAAKE